MEKLKSILKLEFIKNIPKENKMAYLVSVGMGIGASILVTIIPNFFSHGTGFKNNIFALFIFTPIPILSILLLWTLFKKFPVVWNNIKVRIICSVILLVVYIYSFCFILLAISGDRIYKIFFLPLYMFIGIIGCLFANLSQTSLLSTFLFLSIFIAGAVYFVTKGIENLTKKIVLFFIIGFLIFISAITPLIMGYMSTFS